MTPRLDAITEQRLQKIERLRARNIEPYPHRYQRSHTAEQAVALLEQQENLGKTETPEVSIAGRIMSIRRMGKSAFFDIRDSSGKIQLLFQKCFDCPLYLHQVNLCSQYHQTIHHQLF